MSAALQLVERIRSVVRPIEEKILAHRCLRVLEPGQLPGRLIHRSARMLQSYELMFWDATAGSPGTPREARN